MGASGPGDTLVMICLTAAAMLDCALFCVSSLLRYVCGLRLLEKWIHLVQMNGFELYCVNDLTVAVRNILVFIERMW
jgi:hypothetical protein